MFNLDLTSVIFFIAILLIGVNFGVLFYLIKKTLSLAKQEEKITQHAIKTLNKARHIAQEVIQNSLKKADQTLSDTETIHSDMVTKINNQLDALSDELMYGLKSQTKKEAVHLVKELEDETKKDLADFEKELVKSELKTQQRLEKEFGEEFSKAKSEIEGYKAQKLAKLDADISQIVAEVLENVSAKIIPVSTHEEIVLEELEKAKKEHFIV